MSEEYPAVELASFRPPESELRGGFGSAAYVALGDSFTAGTGCPPGARWPDRLAQALRASRPGLVYRNYAEKGATTERVLRHQVPRANQLEPALVTAICGANDVLESVRPDVPVSALRLAAIFDRIREAAPASIVVSATMPEQWRFLGLGERTRRRVDEGIRAFNEQVRELAAERDVVLLEVAGNPDLDDPENFGDDGLHPSIAGHRKAAEAIVSLLARHLSQ